MSSGDSIATKTLVVDVQENGIIRRSDTGYLIGRLVDDCLYKNLPNDGRLELEEDTCQKSQKTK